LQGRASDLISARLHPGDQERIAITTASTVLRRCQFANAAEVLPANSQHPACSLTRRPACIS